MDLYSGEGLQRLLAALRARAGIGAGEVKQPAKPDSPSPELAALRLEAARGQKPSARQAAIRRIAIRYGAAELPWLRSFAYSAKYWASRREAIDQIVRLDPPELVEWLIEMAETHPVDNNRRHAMDHVAAREGAKCFAWLLYRVQEESSFWTRYRASELFRASSRSVAQENHVVRPQEIDMLRRAASAEGHPDLRARLVGSLLNLCAQEPWARQWFETLLRAEKGTYYRAELLGAALRVWEDADLLAQLQQLAVEEPDKEDTHAVGRDHARMLLRNPHLRTGLEGEAR